MTTPSPSTLTEAVSLRSGLLSTTLHALLLGLMIAGHNSSQNDLDAQQPDDFDQADPVHDLALHAILRLPSVVEQADITPDVQAAPPPLPDLDLDALPPMPAEQAISAAPAPSLGEPSADTHPGPLSGGGLEISLPALDRINAVDIAPAMTAAASRPDTDQRLREWQNVAEYLQDIILRRNWHNNWQPRFQHLITNRDLIAEVDISQRGFISRFRLIRGTGVDELDGFIEGFFQNAEGLNTPPIAPDNSMQYLHLRLP